MDNQNSKSDNNAGNGKPNSGKGNKKRKPRNYPENRNTTESQYLSYKNIKGGNQEDFILKLMTEIDEPVTRRQLEEKSGIRQSSMTRIMYNLVKGGRIVIMDELKQCVYTGRFVQTYKIFTQPIINKETGTVQLPVI